MHLNALIGTEAIAYATYWSSQLIIEVHIGWGLPGGRMRQAV
jgi:hypothetical protein